MQVVHNMTLQGFEAGENILHQGAAVAEHDFLYLLSTGEVDVVISGAGTHNASEDHRVSLKLILRTHVLLQREAAYSVNKGEGC